MFTLYQIAFSPARQLYRIGLLFTHTSTRGDFGATSVTEQSCSSPISKVEPSRIGWHGFSYYSGGARGDAPPPPPPYVIFRRNCPLSRGQDPPLLAIWGSANIRLSFSLCIAVTFGSKVIVVHAIYQPNTSTQLFPRLLPSLQSAKF